MIIVNVLFLSSAARVLATPAVTQYAPAIKTAYASREFAKIPSVNCQFVHNIIFWKSNLSIQMSFYTALLQGTIANIAYSPASEVSHVYSSIAAQQYAVPQYAAQQYAVPQDAAQQYAIPQYAASQYAYGAAPLAIGSSQQSTIRSLGGTISTYSKAVDTAFSSVRKADTRISNNVYIPALATKTIAVQQPAIIEQKSIPAIVSHVTFDAPSIGAHYSW